MNIHAHALEASIFPRLEVSSEFVVQGDRVYFSMNSPRLPHIFLTAAVDANHAESSLDWNTTSDPQNGFDVDYDLLQVNADSRPAIDGFENIMAMQGQQFEMTLDQITTLNEMLSEYFADAKVAELKGMAA